MKSALFEMNFNLFWCCYDFEMNFNLFWILNSKPDNSQLFYCYLVCQSWNPKTLMLQTLSNPLMTLSSWNNNHNQMALSLFGSGIIAGTGITNKISNTKSNLFLQ